MSPDDERHGTRRGYYAHRRAGEQACDPCKRGAAGGEARQQYDRAHGIVKRVDATGTRRRLQALAAIGYTWHRIDSHLGMVRMSQKWANDPRSYILAASAAKVARVYDTLSMTLPPQATKDERISASKARNKARRNDWPPPLAWDDDKIDDPAYMPADWRYRPTDRGEQIRELADNGAGVSEVCRRMHLSPQSLEKWCERHDRALWARLKSREHTVEMSRKRWTA